MDRWWTWAATCAVLTGSLLFTWSDATFTGSASTQVSVTAAAAFPLVHYAFDETGGSTAHEARGGADATYGAAAVVGAPGYAGRGHSVGCDGSDASNVTYPQTLQFTGRSPWSLEVRFKASVVDADYHVLFTKGAVDGGFASRLGVLVVVNDTYGIGVERYDNAGGRDAVYTGVAPPVDTWIHLAVVYDGASLSLYQDGQLMAQGPATVSVPSTAAYTADSCYYRDYPGGDFRGWIDDLRLFDQALNAAQVAADAA